MEFDESDLRDLIDNELRRVKIQNHAAFNEWHDALKPVAREVVDRILKEDVTTDVILLAQDSSDEEWHRLFFLRIVGGGFPNPNVQLALTNMSLEYIWYDLESFGMSKGK